MLFALKLFSNVAFCDGGITPLLCFATFSAGLIGITRFRNRPHIIEEITSVEIIKTTNDMKPYYKEIPMVRTSEEMDYELLHGHWEDWESFINATIFIKVDPGIEFVRSMLYVDDLALFLEVVDMYHENYKNGKVCPFFFNQLIFEAKDTFQSLNLVGENHDIIRNHCPTRRSFYFSFVKAGVLAFVQNNKRLNKEEYNVYLTFFKQLWEKQQDPLSYYNKVDKSIFVLLAHYFHPIGVQEWGFSAFNGQQIEDITIEIIKRHRQRFGK